MRIAPRETCSTLQSFYDPSTVTVFMCDLVRAHRSSLVFFRTATTDGLALAAHATRGTSKPRGHHVLPIRDDAPSRRVPWVVLTIVVLNVAVLCCQNGFSAHGKTLVGSLGLIPSRFVRWVALGGVAHDPWRFLPLGTSMFLHDGWLHLGTNMLYLWTFGRALEARLGRAGMAATYLFSGIASALGQLIAHPHSNAAMIGASGAIAGLLGAYLVCYPRATITVAFPFLLVPWVLRIRACWFLLGWFALQIGKGTMDLLSSVNDPQVAWWAHATGFLTGLTGAVAGCTWPSRDAPARSSTTTPSRAAGTVRPPTVTLAP